MTEKLYSLAPNLPTELTELTETEFISILDEVEKKSRLPEVFHGFYDDRLLGEFELESAVNGTTDRAFEEIFSADSKEFFSRLTCNQNDLDQLLTLKGSLKKNDIFEFDNQKRKASELHGVISNLEKEIEQGLETKKQLDKHAFQYYCSLAQSNGCKDELVSFLNRIFYIQGKVRASAAITEKLQRILQQLGSRLQWTEKELNELNLTIAQLEGEFKSFLTALPYSLVLEKISDREKFESYAVNTSEFFIRSSAPSQEGLDLLSGRIFEVLGLLHEMRFEVVMQLTTLQLELTPKRYLKT